MASCVDYLFFLLGRAVFAETFDASHKHRVIDNTVPDASLPVYQPTAVCIIDSHIVFCGCTDQEQPP